MNLFDNLSDLLEWSKFDEFSENEQDSNLGLDQVALDNSNVLPPPSPQLAPFAGPSSLGGPVAPKKKGHLIGARMLALTMFKDA